MDGDDVRHHRRDDRNHAVLITGASSIPESTSEGRTLQKKSHVLVSHFESKTSGVAF